MGLSSKLNQAAGVANSLNAAQGKPSAPPYPGAPGGGYPPSSTPAGYPGHPAPAPAPGGYGAPTPQQYPPAPSNPGGYPPAPAAQQQQHSQQQPGGYPPASGGQAGYPAAPGHQQPASQYGATPGAYPAPGQQQQQGYGQQPPQQQYGQQPAHGAPAAAGGPPAAGNAGMQQGLQQKLQNMIQTNRLEAFYPPQQLQALMTKLMRVDFRALAQKWNMPLELATDLASLALYDIVIFADDSGSMVFEEGGERIDDLKLILGRVAEVGTLFDDDGIIVRFMNSNVNGDGIRDAAAASALVGQVQFNGLTPLGSQLDAKVIRPFLVPGIQGRNLQKPILVIVITDGEPAGEPPQTIVNVIQNAKNLAQNSPYGGNAISFEFAQVGKNQKAQQFLGSLDNHPVIGSMVDATSYYELEAEEYAKKGVTLTPDLWLVKLMVGAIDPSYDEQD